MKRKLSAFLLIALVFSLPLRAVAGVSMILCGSGHHGMTHGEMAHDPDGGGPMSSASADMHGHHHPGGQMHDSGSHSPVPCSTCGDCCAVALSGPLPYHPVLGLDVVSTVIAFPVLPYTNFVPDGPERPPRTSVL
jgi:hypothetical protein